MCKQSTGELIATARLHILTLAQELEKNSIFLESARIVRDEDDNIVELGLHSPYYDIPPAGCRTMGEQHLFHDWMAHPEDAPDNWNPVTKALDD